MITAALRGFIAAGSMTQERCPATLGSPEFLSEQGYSAAALSPRCPLLARKFAPAATQPLLRLYRSCTAGLGILPCDPTLTRKDSHWWE